MIASLKVNPWGSKAAGHGSHSMTAGPEREYTGESPNTSSSPLKPNTITCQQQRRGSMALKSVYLYLGPVALNDSPTSRRKQRQLPATPLTVILSIVALVSSTLFFPTFAFLSGARYRPAFGIKPSQHASVISRHQLYTSDYSHPRHPFTKNMTTTTTTNTMTNLRTNPQRQPQQPLQRPKFNLTLVLIDHYDSFTYNLYDMLAQLCEQPPIVLAKDAFDDWSQIVATVSDRNIDGIILSPGPGTPTNPDDIGTLSTSAIAANPDLPILGVCLGHQILGHVYGAHVGLVDPVHGQVRRIEQTTSVIKTDHDESSSSINADPLWKQIPDSLHVTRYHSLAVTLPENQTVLLRPTAFTTTTSDSDRQILMGMSHTQYPHYGVQFHPESIGSEHGLQLLENFCDICRQRKQSDEDENNNQLNNPINVEKTSNGVIEPQDSTEILRNDIAPKVAPNGEAHSYNDETQRSKFQVLVQKVGNIGIQPLEMFDHFLATEPFSVWLDTSRGIQSAASATTPTSYCSIMGAGSAPIEYYGKEHDECHQGIYQYDRSGKEKVKASSEDILTYLQKDHSTATDTVTIVDFDQHEAHERAEHSLDVVPDDADLLPFDFRGGHVGYLGYEVRRDTQRFLEDQESGNHGAFQSTRTAADEVSQQESMTIGGSNDDRVPTAAFLFLDKSWVYDHAMEEWYLVSVVNCTSLSDHARVTAVDEVVQWMHSTSKQMKERGSFHHAVPSVINDKANGSQQRQPEYSSPIENDPSHVEFIPNRSRDSYNQNFAECQKQIGLGESYELCLTNKLEASVTVPSASGPLDLYKTLRKRNPAPFSAFLNWGTDSHYGENQKSSSLAICCSSPERFVSVKPKHHRVGVNGSAKTIKTLQVEAKPIKGTCARLAPLDKEAGYTEEERAEDQRRALDLQTSVKNRAENLMIVDLLRNDLSRVCEIGSVHVSNLMDIESYATVHQMVSTIRGRLDPDKANAVDVLKATFPGGSMTGAPKISTMEILERIEEGVNRGPYAGCMGYISMNGSMDMNIVIRTAIVTPDRARECSESEIAWNVSVGAGGAITALSESTDEYEEMLLKASAVVNSVREWATTTQPQASETLPTMTTASIGQQ